MCFSSLKTINVKRYFILSVVFQFRSFDVSTKIGNAKFQSIFRFLHWQLHVYLIEQRRMELGKESKLPIFSGSKIHFLDF